MDGTQIHVAQGATYTLQYICVVHQVLLGFSPRWRDIGQSKPSRLCLTSGILSV